MFSSHFDFQENSRLGLPLPERRAQFSSSLRAIDMLTRIITVPNQPGIQDRLGLEIDNYQAA